MIRGRNETILFATPGTTTRCRASDRDSRLRRGGYGEQVRRAAFDCGAGPRRFRPGRAGQVTRGFKFLMERLAERARRPWWRSRPHTRPRQKACSGCDIGHTTAPAR